MKNDNDILSKIGGKSGMTVPDGYFADFAKRMTHELPQREQEATNSKILPRSRWQQIRPYVYLAAMFMGIWCMMKMFDLMRSDNSVLSIDNNPTLISAISDASFVDDFYYDESVSSYELLEDMYDQGVSTDEFTEFVSLK